MHYYQAIERQEDVGSSGLNTTQILTYTLAAVVGNLLAQLILSFYRDGVLQDDPSCGVVTGGREECYWDCQVSRVDDLQVVNNPECLRDCFPAAHCVQQLLDDYEAAGGICQGSLGDNIFNTGGNVFNTVPCTVNVFLGLPTILSGVCSVQTEADLVEQESCIYDVYKRPSMLSWIVYRLVRDMCRDSVFRPAWNNAETDLGRQLPAQGRYVPLETVNILDDGSPLRTELQFENTRNRYPCLLIG